MEIKVLKGGRGDDRTGQKGRLGSKQERGQQEIGLNKSPRSSISTNKPNFLQEEGRLKIYKALKHGETTTCCHGTKKKQTPGKGLRQQTEGRYTITPFPPIKDFRRLKDRTKDGL